MILNTGSRTDIPAFYSTWFYNRIRAGYVLARNPYYPHQVTRYVLRPGVIDALVFCTKNPSPMLRDFALLADFSMFWFVTITPYGREIEPRVPPPGRVAEACVRLSELVGPERVSWRYDPVFISSRYSVEYHLESFARLARALDGAVRQCVISFIDLYEKTRRNFPSAREVSAAQQRRLTEAFAGIAREHGLRIHLCCESPELAGANVDADGCLSRGVLERAIGSRLMVPGKPRARAACPCLLGADIGAYNSCPHGCLYCYANYDAAAVRRSLARHDPNSPFLIGGFEEGDTVRDAVQVSWRDPQADLFASI